MKVTTDDTAARALAQAGEPVLFSHLDGPLFERRETEAFTEFVFGRRYPGLFDANDGSFIAVEAGKDGAVRIDRDRYGAIPLYYATGRPIISTDLRLIVDALEPDLDHDSLAEYVSASYLTGGRTVYRGIRWLMPDETLSFTGCDIVVSKKNIFPPQAGLGAGELQDRLEAAIDNSIADLVQRYPGPLLLNLSGGADSTLLLAKIRQAGADRAIATTTYFHDDWRSDLNDWEYAAEAARTYRSEHRLFKVGNAAFCEAHRELMSKARSVFHTYAAAFYFQNSAVSVAAGVPIVNGSGPDESIIGTEKVPLPELLALRDLKRDAWIDHLIGHIDYLKMSKAAVGAVLRVEAGDFVERRKALAARLVDAPDFVEFQRRYHALTVLQDHIQELSMVARVVRRPILFPYLTNDIFRIVFAAGFEALNEGHEYKSIVKKILTKFMPRQFVYRKKIGFQSPSRPYFKSQDAGLGRELARLLRNGSRVLNMEAVTRGLGERLGEELDLYRRYDFLEWTAYNILRLEEDRGADA